MSHSHHKHHHDLSPNDSAAAAEDVSAPQEGAVPPGIDNENLAAEVSRLRQELEAKQKEAAENYDRLLRNQAETDNFRKRMQKEKADTIKFANEVIISELLPVLDNLERALQVDKNVTGFEHLRQGVEQICQQLQGILAKAGLSPLSAKGEAFDPNKHQAVAHLESAEYPPDTVVEEMQRGYKLHDRVLRPAMVAVAKEPEKPKKEGDTENG